MPRKLVVTKAKLPQVSTRMQELVVLNIDTCLQTLNGDDTAAATKVNISGRHELMEPPRWHIFAG